MTALAFPSEEALIAAIGADVVPAAELLLPVERWQEGDALWIRAEEGLSADALEREAVVGSDGDSGVEVEAVGVRVKRGARADPGSVRIATQAPDGGAGMRAKRLGVLDHGAGQRGDGTSRRGRDRIVGGCAIVVEYAAAPEEAQDATAQGGDQPCELGRRRRRQRKEGEGAVGGANAG